MKLPQPSAREIASMPRRWQPDESGDGLTIPPTTPRHPTKPWFLEEIPAGQEGPETPAHAHPSPQWVRGWCACVWIVWQPGHGAPPLTDRAHLMHAPATPVGKPSPLQVARVVEEFRQVNAMLFEECRIAFQVCDVILLDSSRLLSGAHGRETSLADQFTAEGKLEVRGEQSGFAAKILDIMTNGNSDAFREKMWKCCVHLFLTHDVEDPTKPGAVQGVGGVFGPVTTPVSYGIVDAGSTQLAQTIVHEIIHALGQDEHSTQPGSVFQEAIGEGDTTVDSRLCEPLLDYLADHIDPACP